MIELWNGDCLDLMKNISDKSIDCVICNPPYGTTPITWDKIIPFDKLWEEYIGIELYNQYFNIAKKRIDGEL